MSRQYWCGLDGSGKPRSHRFISLGGYLGEVNRQEDFGSEWRVNLRTLGLSSVHMSEAMRWAGWWARKKSEWGDGCDHKRREVLLSFAAIIRKYPLVPIGIAADSRHVTAKQSAAKHPELLLVENAIQSAMAFLQADDYLCLLFDWEDGYDVVCCKLMAKLRTHKPDLVERLTLYSFGNDRRYAELQAADMFAYFTRQELERTATRPREEQDPVYVALTEGGPNSLFAAPIGGFYSDEQLQRLLAAQRS